jgi:hypothetical protein
MNPIQKKKHTHTHTQRDKKIYCKQAKNMQACQESKNILIKKLN